MPTPKGYSPGVTGQLQAIRDAKGDRSKIMDILATHPGTKTLHKKGGKVPDSTNTEPIADISTPAKARETYRRSPDLDPAVQSARKLLRNTGKMITDERTKYAKGGKVK